MTQVDPAQLKKQGFIQQREEEYFTVRIKILAGNITGEQMRGLSEISNAYARGYAGLTARLGIEIPWVKLEDLEKVRVELEKIGLKPGGTGRTVRAIVACKGTVCAHGLIDTQGLCAMLDQGFFGEELPAKFKMGVAGCPNNCAKVQLHDLGFMGQCLPQIDEDLCDGCGECIGLCPTGALKKSGGRVFLDESRCILCGKCIKHCPAHAVSMKKHGVALFLGGKFGKRYTIGQDAGVILSPDEALAATRVLVDFYRDNARPGERFGIIVGRVGIEEVRAVLMRRLGRPAA